MGKRTFALILGIVYLLVGVLGLIPSLITSVVHDGVAINTLEGNLLGIFPVNIVHTLVHLIIGIWGIMAYRSYDASRTFAKVVGVLFLILFLMGVVPGLNTMFGMAPLMGADVWLHLLTGLAGVYFGFVHRDNTVDRMTGTSV